MKLTRRDVLALTSGAALLAGAGLLALWIGPEPNRAQLVQGWLTFPAIAVGMMLFLAKWWWGGRRTGAPDVSSEQLDRASTLLADRCASTWRKQAAELGITKASPVAISWETSHISTPLGELATEVVPGAHPPAMPISYLDSATGASKFKLRHSKKEELSSSGDLRFLHEIYARLPAGRMALVGEGGAGKTAGLILLLLAALEHRKQYRRTHPTEDLGPVPVPVLLSLNSWRPAHEALSAWVARTIYRDFPDLRSATFGSGAVEGLIDAGLIALFLDGLDEMAAGDQIRALNKIAREAVGLRVVMTSRTDVFVAAQRRATLEHTAVLEVSPVTATGAATYLRAGHTLRHSREAWGQVADYVQADEQSVLSQALNNPLFLSLAKSTYGFDSSDPRELCDTSAFPSVSALRHHLLAGVVPSAFEEADDRQHYAFWLGWIAHNMGPARDVAWWTIPMWVPGARGLTGALAGLIAGLAVGTTGLAGGLAVSLIITLVMGIAVGVTVGALATRGAHAVPMDIVVRRIRIADLPVLLRSGKLSMKAGASLATGIGGGMACGVGGGLAAKALTEASLLEAIAAGLAGAVVTVLGALLLACWEQPLPLQEAVTPENTYAADRRSIRTFIHFSGCLFGAAGAVMGAVIGNLRGDPEVSAMLGCLFGTFGGYGVGVAGSLSGMSGRLRFAEFLVRRRFRRTRRPRFVNLLAVACQKQILRQSGAVWQFRHAELQEFFASAHLARCVVDKGHPTASGSAMAPIALESPVAHRSGPGGRHQPTSTVSSPPAPTASPHDAPFVDTRPPV